MGDVLTSLYDQNVQVLCETFMFDDVTEGANTELSGASTCEFCQNIP